MEIEVFEYEKIYSVQNVFQNNKFLKQLFKLNVLHS